MTSGSHIRQGHAALHVTRLGLRQGALGAGKSCRPPSFLTVGPAILRVYQAIVLTVVNNHLRRWRCGLGGLVRASRSASSQCPARDGNTQSDEDGEPEHGVGCACTLVERDSGSDHRNREPHKESDE